MQAHSSSQRQQNNYQFTKNPKTKKKTTCIKNNCEHRQAHTTSLKTVQKNKTEMTQFSIFPEINQEQIIFKDFENEITRQSRF